jgi:ABC-type phosphate transport system substrate-binding protein
MKGHNLKPSLLIGAILLGCTTLTLAQGGIAVVVSPRNSQTTIAMGELRKILAGEKRYWSDGAAVKLFTRSAGTAEHDAMLKLVGMSETEYKQYWRSKVYAGDAQSEPVSLPSNGMQREALQTYPGGIALVDNADVKPGMKVLKIDGKMPGEEGYPLQR